MCGPSLLTFMKACSEGYCAVLRLFPSAGLAYSITGRSAVSPQCVRAGPLVRSPLGVSLCGRCGGAGLSGARMALCALSSVMKGG